MGKGSELVSVVIINFNSGRFIEKCITALEAQTYRAIEIIVIDNDSKDGSIFKLREWACSGRLRLFESTNVGFSKANNLGIRESRGEFLLILNADAFLDRDFVRQCVVAMTEYTDVGTVAGKLLSDVDHSTIDSAGLYVFREGLAVDRGFGEKDWGQFDHMEYVDGACGAAAFYRRNMLEQIRSGDQFYNESFFAFAEDVELSFRASQRGWRTLYIPSAIGYHVRGGSTQSLSEFTTYLNERNLRVFLNSWFNPTARISDRILQWILLRLRDIKIRRHLSPQYRRKLKSEIREMTQNAAYISRPHSAIAGHFYTTGRKSFLLQAVWRKLGIGSRNQS